MQRICFILFFLCAILDYRRAGAQGHVKVFDYYKYTNLAELAICDSNFAEANKHYKAAFAVNPDKAFYKDLYNAFSSAMDTREYALAEQYFSKMSRLYIDSVELALLKKAYKSESLQRLNVMITKYRPVKIEETPLVKKLNEMYKLDQGVRAYFSRLNDGHYMVDSVYKVDQMNALELFKIFKEQGIPQENVLMATRYDIIIHHNSGNAPEEYAMHIFDTLLFNGIFSFDYDARGFPSMVQTGAIAPYFSHRGILLHLPLTVNGCSYGDDIGEIYPEYWDEPSEKRMNEDRAKIGLETLDELRKKISAYNKKNNAASVLHKYKFSINMGVMHISSKERLNEWLAEYGENATRKKNVSTQSFTASKPKTFEIGYLSDKHVIGKTTWNEKMKWRNTLLANGYNETVICYGNWKNMLKPSWYLVAAVVTSNPVNDYATDSSRYDKARFVPGYNLLLESGFEFQFRQVYNYSLSIFDNNTDSTLISFTANVDTLFYKLMIKQVAQPTTFITKADTVNRPGESYKVILNSRHYTWVKGNNKVEIEIKEQLNVKGKKYTIATLHMYDAKRYKAYLQKVEEEKKRLDKIYAEKK